MFGHAKEKISVLYSIVLLLVFSVSVAPTAVIVNAQQVPDEDCAFTPTLAKCKPDQKGKCPSGFSLNVNSECIPNKCPKGFVRHDNDQTGKCFAIGKSGTATFKVKLNLASYISNKSTTKLSP
jgi:hypothetical protein